jgi:hypothetical protein
MVVKECHCTYLPLWSQQWKHGGSFICSENGKVFVGKRGWKTRVLRVKDWGSWGAHRERVVVVVSYHWWGKETTSLKCKQEKPKWCRKAFTTIHWYTNNNNTQHVARSEISLALAPGWKKSQLKPTMDPRPHKPISTFGVLFFFFFFWGGVPSTISKDKYESTYLST